MKNKYINITVIIISLLVILSKMKSDLGIQIGKCDKLTIQNYLEISLLMLIAPTIFILLFSQILEKETFTKTMLNCNLAVFMLWPLATLIVIITLILNINGNNGTNLLSKNYIFSYHAGLLIVYTSTISILMNNILSNSFWGKSKSKINKFIFVYVYITITLLPIILKLFFNNGIFLNIRKYLCPIKI